MDKNTESWKIDVVIRIIEILKQRPINYSRNDYETNFSVFVHSHETDEVISRMFFSHSGKDEISFSELFDELVNESLTMRQADVLRYSYDEKYKEEVLGNASDAAALKRDYAKVSYNTLSDACKNLQKKFGMERLFYNKEDTKKMTEWDKTSPYKRHKDVLDIKLVELDCPESMKLNLIRLALRKGIKKHDTQFTVRDVIDFMNEIDTVSGCGAKKARDIKNMLIKVMSSHSSDDYIKE